MLQPSMLAFFRFLNYKTHLRYMSFELLQCLIFFYCTCLMCRIVQFSEVKLNESKLIISQIKRYSILALLNYIKTVSGYILIFYDSCYILFLYYQNYFSNFARPQSSKTICQILIALCYIFPCFISTFLSL